VQALGGDSGRFAPGMTVLGERGHRALTVASSRPLGAGEMLLTFEELPTREEAAALRGDYLCVERSQRGRWAITSGSSGS